MTSGQRATPFRPRETARTVDEAILSRRCVRVFTDDPVPRDDIEHLLALASRSPSGSNIQPWKVIVVTGAALARITKAMHTKVMADGEASIRRDYHYYPTQWRDPYLARRRKLGWDLYGLLGIGRGDRDKANEYRARNFLFFGAPVGLIFTMDRDLEMGSWIDYGIFLQTIMLAARGRGLDTCPQAAIAEAHEILHPMLDIPPSERILCGMALGYSAEAPLNHFVTEREPVATFTRFLTD